MGVCVCDKEYICFIIQKTKKKKPGEKTALSFLDFYCHKHSMCSSFLAGRNYGYAKFANKESAMKAIQFLHGQNLSGQRVKVLEAEPPKHENEDGPSKKQRT